MSIGPDQDGAAVDLVPPAPEPPRTGDGPVDEALVRLAAVMSEQLEDHVDGYDAIHRTLTDRLADVEG